MIPKNSTFFQFFFQEPMNIETRHKINFFTFVIIYNANVLLLELEHFAICNLCFHFLFNIETTKYTSVPKFHHLQLESDKI